MRWGCNHFHKTSFEPAVCIVLMSKLGQLSSHFYPFLESVRLDQRCDSPLTAFPGHVLPVAAFVSSARDCLASVKVIFPTFWWRGKCPSHHRSVFVLEDQVRDITCLVSGWDQGLNLRQVLLNQGRLEAARIHWNPWWKASNPPWTLLAWPFSVSSKVEALGKRFVSWDRLCTHSFSAKVRGASLGSGRWSFEDDRICEQELKTCWGQMRPGLQKWSYEFPFEFARPGFFCFGNRRLQIRLV